MGLNTISNTLDTSSLCVGGEYKIKAFWSLRELDTDSECAYKNTEIMGDLTAGLGYNFGSTKLIWLMPMRLEIPNKVFSTKDLQDGARIATTIVQCRYRYLL
jgi:hypothetical protein